MFKTVGLLVSLSLLMFFTAAQAAVCKNIQAKISNKTSNTVEVISIDYLAEDGEWRNQMTLQKALQPDVMWTQTLDLNHVNLTKTQVKVSFETSKGNSKAISSSVFTCKNNYPLTLDLK